MPSILGGTCGKSGKLNFPIFGKVFSLRRNRRHWEYNLLNSSRNSWIYDIRMKNCMPYVSNGSEKNAQFSISTNFHHFPYYFHLRYSSIFGFFALTWAHWCPLARTKYPSKYDFQSKISGWIYLYVYGSIIIAVVYKYCEPH